MMMSSSKNYWRKTTQISHQKLDNILRSTKYQIIQSNGQRIFAPSASSGIPPPPKGTEIFIGNLPYDLYEEELIPLFSKHGTIYNLRLMLDFFGRNRGYCFLSYFHVEEAYAAVRYFNNYRIRNKTKISVCMSVDNRRLFIGQIPRNKTAEEVKFILNKHLEGIVDVILYQDPNNPRLNRGFVFVEFQTHRLAAIARRSLFPGSLILWGHQVFVDWAEPLPTVSPEILREVTKLYISNIPVNLTTEELKRILTNLIGTTSGATHILKVHKINDYAFVHFTIRKYAEIAFSQLQGTTIWGHTIKIEWARPIEYSKNYRIGKMPDNFCRSVPPNMRKLVRESISLRKTPKKQQNLQESTSPENSSTSELINNFDNMNLLDINFFD